MIAAYSALLQRLEERAGQPRARVSGRRFSLWVGLFLSPLLLWQLLELFVLPVDFFAFRVWESMVVKTYPVPEMGPFYPNQHVVKYSIGAYDNFYQVKNPRRKLEEWYTDVNGYRNRPRAVPEKGYDVFVWGNSDIVGAFNNQPDILSEAIERTCGLTAYSASGAAIAPMYVSDPLLAERPPRFFVVQLYMDVVPARMMRTTFNFDGFKLREPTRWPVWAMILLDRLDKQPAREWARSRLKITEIQRLVDHFQGTRKTIATSIEMGTEEAFDRMVEKIGIMNAKLKTMGSEIVLLFQPVPKRIHDYRPLIERLRAMNYKLAAWYPTEQWPDGVPTGYWHTEDSHWTEAAILDSAQRICATIHGRSGVEPSPQPPAVTRGAGR